MDDRRATTTEVTVDAPYDGPASPRGPYATAPEARWQAPAPPSAALAENLRAYRLLRHMTQDQLAARMTWLCHGWGRSTVSAVEGRSRNVTVDELFGLAVSVGVTIGQLLDPTGPDRSRPLSLDVGLRGDDSGLPRPVTPRLAHLWIAGRAIIRLRLDDGCRVEVEATTALPAATPEDLERRHTAAPEFEGD